MLIPVFSLLLVSTVSAIPNLFDEGQQGRILGSSFGVPGADATYDYVIVGGGTAGLTVAARLAENPSLSIAVVEAGGFYELDNGNRSVIPALAVFYAGTDPKDVQPLVDWGFVTTPQPVGPLKALASTQGLTPSIAGSEQSVSSLCSRENFGWFISSKLYVLP